jgi:hypothetical protein
MLHVVNEPRCPLWRLFERDLVDRLLDLVDDDVGELGSLLAVGKT